MEISEIKKCKQCKLDFKPEHFNQMFCGEKCSKEYAEDTRKYKTQTSPDKKLDMQLNRMVKWLDKVSPMPKKPKPNLEDIPENMRF